MKKEDALKKDRFKNSIVIEKGEDALTKPAQKNRSTRAFFVYDVKTKQRLNEYCSDSSSASGASGVLIFVCDPSLKLALEPLAASLMQSLSRWIRAMGRFEPTVLNLLIERHWRAHFSQKQLAGIKRYFLVKRRLYSFGASAPESIYVLRQKALLEFALDPDYFIQLEAHDVLVFLDTNKIKELKVERRWATLLEASSVEQGFLKIDKHLPKANLGVHRGKKCRQVEWIGRWLLFCFYAALTGFILFTVFWIL